jgi:SmpB protein
MPPKLHFLTLTPHSTVLSSIANLKKYCRKGMRLASKFCRSSMTKGDSHRRLLMIKKQIEVARKRGAVHGGTLYNINIFWHKARVHIMIGIGTGTHLYYIYFHFIELRIYVTRYLIQTIIPNIVISLSECYRRYSVLSSGDVLRIVYEGIL